MPIDPDRIDGQMLEEADLIGGETDASDESPFYLCTRHGLDQCSCFGDDDAD